ncbi:ABC-type hemin transport system, ATPase component [Sphingobacterium nematocida]|uniref:ABC-type hemin transport system, ATPase component n=1 Tax=Sphingobacterium nematocida TaxID=1513896 RepID=A0A1T5B4J5_9SPHI|nr:heme ABC transporter ATP-binding protein [Sphingobacterium nematocida]SKB41997.1 ABC-type hemin transport system, ATPase component [Sphingobacterium nematocida]
MLRVEKLSYEIKGRKLLKDISFQMRKGEVLAILGANGAGKSTLMGLLCGEKKPTDGAILLNGRALDQYDMKELSRCRAMLSQQQQMTLAFKVNEIVMMGRYPHFRSTPSARDLLVVDEVMDLCGVKSLGDRTFLSLSGGEQQRVQLARVLAQIWDNQDSLLLLDEPISALDLQYQQKVLAIAKALSRRGFMVVLIVHDVNFAAMYADRIIMLKNGRKLIDGTPVEVLNTKDIYTIFSVESVVELSAKTLKPNVKLEELVLDATGFNSLLPNESAMTTERILELLIDKSPYLSTDELARKVGVPEFEIWRLDKRNKTEVFIPDFDRLVGILPGLGKVRICSSSRGARHTLLGCYTIHSCESDRKVIFEGDFDLIFLFNHWHIGMLVENEIGRSLRFFNKNGMELHAISLSDEKDNVNSVERLKALLVNENRDNRWTFCSSMETVEKSRPTENLHDQAISQFRQILALCAANRAPVTIKLINRGCEQSYSGMVFNLIDQGSRYIIKEPTFELEIIWHNIGRITSESRNGAKDQLVIELFDSNDDLILQFFANHAVAKDRRDEVLGKCNKNSVV